MKLFLYIFIWTLFIANQLLQRYFGIVLPFVHCYLDDILLFPILMPFLEYLHFKINGIKGFSAFYVISILLYVSLTVEFIFPQFDSYYTLDYWDFVAYLFGMLFYVYSLKNLRFINVKQTSS